MKLQIKTLSPIHIGNGEKYNGLSYVEDIFSTPKKVFIVDFDKIKRLLNQKDLEVFMNWVVSEDHPSWFKFCKFGLNKPQLQNEFKKVATYTLNNYSTEKYLRDIDCFIKQNNKPYIPGTEIKGAIRTAVAYNLFKKDASWSWLKGELESFGKQYSQDLNRIPGQKGRRVNDIKKKLVDKMGKIEERLQNRLFRANDKDDAKYDVLKMLHIGDTDLKEVSQSLFISDLTTLNISSRRFSIFQELCKKDQIFTSDLRLENKSIILDKLGFSPDQKSVISNADKILQCCYEFSNRLLDEELAYQHYPQKIKDKLKAIKETNKPDSPVIRIGKNEGYLSLTMGLLAKDKDKPLYDNVLCHATKNTSYTGNFPKTRRIVNLGNGDADTCGWVKLQIIT